jgi:3-methyladenine DNA glycosylase/8-oxoguanine DNA glycosylase
MQADNPFAGVAKRPNRAQLRYTRAVKSRGLGFDAGAAAAHLAAKDKRLGRVIEQSGPMRLDLSAARSTFDVLAESIVYQQLNGRAAKAIHTRLCALFPRKRLQPRAVLEATDEQLRSVGLSRGKTLALRDLSARTLDGSVPSITKLLSMTDDAIVESLVKVRGVGRWTVEMLLIFRLGRPDVLPVDDYGVRNGFKLVYAKSELPSRTELVRKGEKWRPFRTVASWYLWRAVDLQRKPQRSSVVG